MGKIIGIDLGTTNSVVAIMEGREPKVIPNEEGARLTPSVVAWDDKGEVLVGQIARRQAITNPHNTVYSIKRFMGMKARERADEVRRVPFKIVEGANGDAHVEIRGKRMAPPEVSAIILQKLKRAAEAYLGEEVKEAVITVPAYFNDSQRQATKDAGRIAGLEVKRLVNEPTAAALAYGLDKHKDHLIAVYDFGGGTFDISILEVGENVVEVISTNGDTHLGGDDLDLVVMDYFIAEFKKENGIDVSKDQMVIQRLKEAAERAKIELSSVSETQINLPFLTADHNGPKHLNMRLSRAKFEQLVDDIFQKTMEPVKRALADASKKPGDVDEVVLVGGSTRIPKVQELVRNYFGKEPHKGVNPDEVVALGAAVQAGVLSGEVKDILLLDVTPLSLGIETLGGVMTKLIERNTTIPTRKTEVFSTASDSQTSVEVHVLQGEREMASGNRTLGRFSLDGIPPAPRGVPQVEVTFDIDANGILHVNAKDKATSREQKITIKASSGITDAEIDRMVKDASEHADEDKRRREEVDTRNNADSLVYTVEKMLKENRDKLPAAEAKNVEEALEEAKTQLKTGNIDEIKAATEKLTQASHKLAEIMYRASSESGSGPNGKTPPGGAAPGDKKKDDGVIDAEFEEQK